VRDVGDVARVCSNRRAPLRFAGGREFRTGGAGGAAVFWFKGWAEVDERKLALALYGCVSCGKVDFYLPSSADREGDG
jgi:hypothetical protein